MNLCCLFFWRVSTGPIMPTVKDLKCNHLKSLISVKLNIIRRRVIYEKVIKRQILLLKNISWYASTHNIQDKSSMYKIFRRHVIFYMRIDVLSYLLKWRRYYVVRNYKRTYGSNFCRLITIKENNFYQLFKLKWNSYTISFVNFVYFCMEKEVIHT